MFLLSALWPAFFSTVPICKAEKKFDPTCLLGKGDHPFLDQKSYVDYFFMNTYSSKVLAEQEQNGILTAKDVVDDKIFAMICGGVEKSRLSPPIYKKHFAENTKEKK